MQFLGGAVRLTHVKAERQQILLFDLEETELKIAITNKLDELSANLTDLNPLSRHSFSKVATELASIEGIEADTDHYNTFVAKNQEILSTEAQFKQEAHAKLAMNENFTQNYEDF